MFRRSKFKHVFGKANKKDDCYDCIRITKSSWDSTFCAVNPKFVAIITETAGGGSFLVLPVEKTGRVEPDVPLVAGHKASVLDIQWCPHNDNLIASASEDCTVKVWQIPDEGIFSPLTEPIADLVAHQRRVGLVVWHPTAENVLLSAGADNMVYIWNVSTEEPLVEMSFPDMITSASFSYDGSKLVVACKDKNIRVVNPRTGEILQEGGCHQGAKPQQCVYLKDNRIFTTGFSRMGERQYGLWKDTDLDTPLTIEDVDTSNGVLFPLYDPDTNVIFVSGKGDSNIRYFEVTDDEPYVHFLNIFSSSEPQRGFGFMPKRGLNVNHNEITRCYKLHSKGLCEVIPFTVPRKSELFQDDLYPDTAGDTPALTADEWMSGKDAVPILISLREGHVAKPTRQFTKAAKPQPKASGDHAPIAVAQSQTQAAPAPVHEVAAKPAPVHEAPAKPAPVQEAPAKPAPVTAKPVGSLNSAASQSVKRQEVPAESPTVESLSAEVRALKMTMSGYEKRIAALEARPSVSSSNGVFANGSKKNELDAHLLAFKILKKERKDEEAGLLSAVEDFIARQPNESSTDDNPEEVAEWAE